MLNNKKPEQKNQVSISKFLTLSVTSLFESDSDISSEFVTQGIIDVLRNTD